MSNTAEFTGHKPHRKPQKGRKAERKKDIKVSEGVDPKIRNPKAFAINSAVRAERKFRRTQDHETKKDRVPVVDRTPVQPPPFIVAIVGPPKVGKSTLFTNLVKNYTRQALSDIKGPVTIVSGKKRRLTLIECNNDINSMIDVAKVADLVLLLVDASFGFEMEVFEFLNICQVHGFPQIMGVLTHLDQFRNKKKLKKTKKTLKHRFWTEVYPGAKLFYLSGYFPMTNTYPKNEVQNLARFISVMKFRPTVWRTEHSYVVADRIEDLTSLEQIRVKSNVDRRISLYGWVHGTYIKPQVSVHIPGLGDYTPDAITALPDPCPLPMKERVLKRSLNEKEKVIYAPFSGVGGIVYDNDAVYIDLGGSHSHKRVDQATDENGEKKSTLFDELRELKTTLDEKMESAGLKLFSQSEIITGAEVLEHEIEEFEDNVEDTENEVVLGAKKFSSVVGTDGRVRRKVLFDDEGNYQNKDEDDITESIFKECEGLRNELSIEAEKDFHDNQSEDDISESDSDLNTDDDSAGTKPHFTNLEKKKSISSLVCKLKSKLNPDIKQKEMSNQTRDIQFDEEDDVDMASDNEDEINYPNSVDNFDATETYESETGAESEDGDENSEYEESDEAVSKSKLERKEINSCISDKLDASDEREKRKRYSVAEEAFYSRFRNRSVQKMVYDDADDYMNISSQADFDLANCHIEGVQQADDEEMKNLFIGGDYADTAKEILDADGGVSDEDVFDDFEELDLVEGTSQKATLKSEKSSAEDEEDSVKKREDIKKKLKEKFDMEYDEGDGGDDRAFYKDWKAKVEEQSKINRTFFEDVEDTKLLRDLQGLAPGTYVRIEISQVPYEFMANFDPQRCCPLVVGSLDSPNQETLAVVQARVKKHRWHPKILKTRDPVIMSIGWRRFQTISLYSVQDHNMRNRMIKYTPEHLHCIANFYGPMTPQGTGILGIAPSGFDGFRITMTGTVIDMDKSSELVKKLKLVGTPIKIFKKSAFIEGMFTSQLEVAKFIGAKIKTVSGIRGVIKKELSARVAPLGAFRATFEDKIVQSDIVFCRTWARVEVPKFFLNLPTMINCQPRVMKTIGQLKRERNIQVEPNPDNLYTPVERTQKNFRPLRIPKSLQEKLPYKEKPKVIAKLNEPKRIAIIKDPHERQMSKFLKTLKSRTAEKEAHEKAEKAKLASEREKKMKQLEVKQNRRQKELRKQVFKTLGQLNRKQENFSGGKGGDGRGKGRPPKHRRN